MSSRDHQVLYEGARDAVCAVLSFYAEKIDKEERHPLPDMKRINRMVMEGARWGTVLASVMAPQADLQGIRQQATEELRRLEIDGVKMRDKE
jgi:hypothetical protein